MDHSVYHTPLTTRYASSQMKHLFSDQMKFSTWRRLWLYLSQAQKECGLPITDAQIVEMSSHLDDIDFESVSRREEQLRHDVMAHVHEFASLCPAASSVIHLGATSCYVTDNTDIILFRDAFEIILIRLVRCLRALSKFANQHKSLATLGFTHLQPAQLTTVGKRACIWAQDLVQDEHSLSNIRSTLLFRGCKGATGTQASFLQLFHGNSDMVRKLDLLVAKMAGFERSYTVCGQTYPRKLDVTITQALASLGSSMHKIATDIRLLAHMKELEEPFEVSQIGSSAMPYKRNPMRCERICSISRYLMSLPSSALHTLSAQWMERTLDDSAVRRITIPQAFLAADAALLIMQNVIEGLVVFPHVIQGHVDRELPFLASENIIVAMVQQGACRQECHEQLRVLSNEAARRIKQEGAMDCDLVARIAGCPYFSPIHADLPQLLDHTSFVGRSAEQVEEFISQEMKPVLEKYSHVVDEQCPINV